MNPYAIPPLLPIAVLLVEGIFVLRRGWRSRLCQVFSATCFLAALWYIQLFLSLSPIDKQVASLLIQRLKLLLPLFIPVSLHLFLLVAGLAHRKRRSIFLSYFLFVFLATLSQFYQVSFADDFSWGRYFRADLFLTIHLTSLAIVLGYGVFLLLRTLFQTLDPQRRLQLGYFLLAIFLGALGAVSDLLPAYGSKLYPLGFIAGAIWPSVVFSMIVKHHLFEIDSLFYREQYYYREVVHQFSEKTRFVTDQSSLGKKLAIIIDKALHPASSLVFLFDEKKDVFTHLASAGGSLILPREGRFEFAGNHSYRMKNGHEIVWSALPDSEAALPSGEGGGDLRGLTIQRTILSLKRPSDSEIVLPLLSVPLIARGKLIGRLNLAPKLSGADYSTRDLQLVLTLTSQAALTMQNIVEERERKKITQLFGRYVTPQVVEEILATYEREGLHLGGRRREVTVLFADIRGFTSMAEKMNPEEVVSLVNECLAVMTQAVFEQQGTLDKYMGDAIMAVFNAPIFQKDHSQRAVATALRIQERMGQVERARNFPVRCGIGINTGDVVVGNIGTEQRLEYTVMGDSVNIAARLCSSAAGGQTLISQRTYELVKENVQVNRVFSLLIKGKEAPVLVYDIKGMVK